MAIGLVRQYTMHRTTVFEVFHDSYRCMSYYFDKAEEVKLPKTVKMFMLGHKSKARHNSILHRDEIIYE